MLKNDLSQDVPTRNYDFSPPNDIRKRSRRVSRVQSGEKVLFQYCPFGWACTARGGRICRFQKITGKITAAGLLVVLLIDAGDVYRAAPRERSVRAGWPAATPAGYMPRTMAADPDQMATRHHEPTPSYTNPGCGRNQYSLSMGLIVTDCH